jgi:hypothetical protein
MSGEKAGEEKAFPPHTPPLLFVGLVSPRGECRPGKIDEGFGENTFSPVFLFSSSSESQI